jgi:hypothetical protein
VAAVDLDELVHVDPGHGQRDQHLDDQLVTGWRPGVGRGAQPLGELSAAGRGDPEALLRAVALRVVGLDQPVALQALQGGVDLPHVERPDLAGPGLELLPKLQTVLRALAQQGQQRVPNAHQHLP